MDPISKEIFTYDYRRFVTQDLAAVPPLPKTEATKKFELYPKKKSEKAKKDPEKKRK